MKWGIAGILAVLFSGAAWVLMRMPPQRYVVACARDGRVTCQLERPRGLVASSSDGDVRRRTMLLADTATRAVVRVLPVRRGTARTLVYFVSSADTQFVAEFEGGDAGTEAADAVEALNRVFGGLEQRARVVAESPAYLRWMAWGMLGVGVLLIGAILTATPRPAATVSQE